MGCGTILVEWILVGLVFLYSGALLKWASKLSGIEDVSFGRAVGTVFLGGLLAVPPVIGIFLVWSSFHPIALWVVSVLGLCVAVKWRFHVAAGQAIFTTLVATSLSALILVVLRGLLRVAIPQLFLNGTTP
jgi:hypothetical protein